MPRRRRRTISTTPAAAIGSRGQAPGASRRPRRTSTVRSGGGPARTLTYHGTPVSKEGIAPSKAPKVASRVEKALERVSKAYKSGPKYGKTFDPDEAASLIKQVGGTDEEARALSTKIMGESGGDPRAVGDDAAAGYGNTFGLGLWQMTTGVGNDDLIAKHGGEKAMLRPKPNARAALELYRTSSSKLGNWYAPSNPPGNPQKVPAKIKPKKSDVKTLAKAGVDPRGNKSPGSGKKPFKAAATKGGDNVAKLIHPKWAPEEHFGTGAHGETILAKGISPVVKKWSKKYDVDVGEAKAESGHVSPGHLETGTATDVYPTQNTEAGWDKLEKGLKVLERQGFEVGYGTNGVGQAWSNHGRGHHAHIEWVGQGSDPKAIQKLAGLTEAQIRKIESGAGGGGGLVSSGGSSGSSSGSSAGGTSSGSGGKSKDGGIAERLSRAQAAYSDVTGPSGVTPGAGSSSSTLSALKRRYGRAVV